MAEQARAAAPPLTSLPEGARGHVTHLDQVESQATAHLIALGVLPGAELTLVQRYPAFVLRIGNAEFAVDSELAGRIHVG